MLPSKLTIAEMGGGELWSQASTTFAPAIHSLSRDGSVPAERECGELGIDPGWDRSGGGIVEGERPNAGGVEGHFCNHVARERPRYPIGQVYLSIWSNS